MHELKTNSEVVMTRLLFEFHFKQSINRITTDEDKRKTLLDVFNNNSKQEFKDKVLELKKDITEKKDKIL